MDISLSLQAVNAALNSSWNTAIDCNEKILKKDPDDIAALNRIAYAYLELGNVNKAQKYYRLVLKIDSYNQIALKNIKKIKESSFPKKSIERKRTTLPMSIFLEEPGKTKVVGLLKLASKNVLVSLRPGDNAILKPKKHYIVVEDCQENYLGSLPDDLSFRLLKLIKIGNQYEAFVRSSSKNSLFVFIKETFRSKRLNNTPSFVCKNDFLSQKNVDKSGKDDSNSEYEEIQLSSEINDYNS